MTESLVKSVNHIGLTVTDLDRSLAFYTEVLECSVVMRQEKKGGYLAAIVGYPDAEVSMAHLRMPGADQRIELFEYRVPRSVERELEPCNVGNAHICFVVEDLDRMYERLVVRGVQTISPPVAVDTGVNKGGAALYLRDPDGITIEIFQPPHRIEGES
ncbi:VOC family protein [Acidimicrobiaceae bacterium USS-CC1]|uniref:VOC family protein n=1 Tax=Acidiferrimicrobium australe TaxID=2664430 RepID=A0ABW9QNT5_9ACTN|nr:VOC family protein [Acidiferrimicrobium australe]